MTPTLPPPLAEIDDPHVSSGWSVTRHDHEEALHTQVLRELCDLGRPLHLGAAGVRGIRATLQLVDVMQQQLVLQCTADGIAVARVLQQWPLWAAAHLHSLRVQFALAAASAAREGPGEGSGRGERFLIRAHWPREIYRAPRRRSVRLRCVSDQAPMARFHHGTRLVSTRAYAVIDISEHGCAVRLPAGVAPPAPDSALRQVELQLDDEQLIVTDASVVHVDAIGGGGHQIGCSWQDIPAPARLTLRRWLAHAAQGAQAVPAVPGVRHSAGALPARNQSMADDFADDFAENFAD